MTQGIARRDFALVFTVLLVVAAGNTALQSVLPAIGRAIGMPDMLVAIIFSFSALLWTFTAPFWARQSDRRGRRLLMQVGVGGFGVSMLLCAAIILAGIHGAITAIITFVLFALARALFGLFGSASNPAAQAYVAARTSEVERTGSLSTLSSAFGLGTILGPAVAPLFVLPVLGLSGPMFAFALIALAVMLLVQRLLPDDDPTHAHEAGHGAPASMPSVGGSPTGASAVAADRGRQPRLSWRDPRIRPYMVYGFAIGSIQAAASQALGFLIIDRAAVSPVQAPQLIAIALMAGAAATLLAQWGLIRMLRLGPRQLLFWGALLAGLGCLGIGVARDFHGIVVAFALASLGFGFARPGFTAGSSLAVERAEQGAVAGAVTSVNGACYILAPAAGIGLYELAPASPYLLSALGLAALVAYAATNPVLRSDHAVVEAPTDEGGPA